MQLEGLRLAVYSLAEQELNGHESADDLAPGYVEDLGEEGLRQAQYCASHVAHGECSLLDIVPRSLNGMAVYTTNNSTMSLLEGIVRPSEIVDTGVQVLVDGESAVIVAPRRKLPAHPNDAFRRVMSGIIDKLKRE